MKQKFIGICLINILLLNILGCSSAKSNNKSYKNKNSIQTNSKLQSSTLVNKDSNLKTKEISWYFVPNKDHTTPRCVEEGEPFLKKYDAYYIGDPSKKDIYLTFDEGYENGYSAKILDVLKQNNVKAAFFVTTTYINANKDLIKRMTDEGHLVCNHSTTHPSMASIHDIDKFNGEFKKCEEAYKSVTGKEMPKFFRPPMGKFSEESLKRTKDLGYKTIFWSFAYRDWIPTSQPSPENAKKTIIERIHPGAIYLLHAVSKTNTEVLSEVIKDLRKQGYTFKTLNELPKQPL